MWYNMAPGEVHFKKPNAPRMELSLKSSLEIHSVIIFNFLLCQKYSAKYRFL